MVTAGISVRAGIGISTGHAARAAALQCAAVKILLRDGLKRLLALRGVNADGINQAKAQLLFGRENRRAATCEEHCADACGCTGSSADCRTGAPVCRSADERAESGGGADGRGVLTVGSSARAFPKFGENGHLTAVDHGEISELDSQLGCAFDAAGFARFLDLANEHLAAPCHDPAIDDQRVFQHGSEMVADLVTVARKVVIDPYEKDRSGGDGQSARNGLSLRSGGRRCIGGVLRWPVV